MEGYRIRAGSVIGHSHKRKGTNNQDAWMAGRYEHCFYGAVFDGCSGKNKSRNEVGATLLAAFFESEIPFVLAANTPISEVPPILYQRALGFFGSIARSAALGSPDAMWEFVQKHLMCTVLGFITDGVTLLIFSAGDGAILIDDEVRVLDQDDAPSYLGYHLVDRRLLRSSIPSSFEVLTLPLSDVQKFALSTDGLVPLIADAPELTQELWNNERSAHFGLQWFLNRQALESRFSDDCTVIAVELNGERKSHAS